MPASSSPISILVTRSSTDGDSVSAIAFRDVPAFSTIEFARNPHGAVSTQRPTVIPEFTESERLVTSVILPANREVGLTMISPTFFANTLTVTVLSAFFTAFIVASLAETKTSAGDPFTIWVASVADDP